LLLSTILTRLWVALAIPPSGQDIIITWALFCGYCLLTIPTGLVKTLVNFEPIQVWWNLELYRDGLRLRNNRKALQLMVMLFIWVTIEELIFRVCLIPLAFENLLLPNRLGWISLAALLAIARYILVYRYWHPLFKKRHFLILATLLEIACLLAYIFTESLWMSVLLHWLITVVWLLPLGGKYQLQQYKIWHLENTASKPYFKD
jgi:predicted Abi (CAAX) family protease